MSDAGQAIERVVATLTQAWNAGDSAAFAAEFVDDAEFVNIFAMHMTGREAIAKQHEFIFTTVYRGSHNTFTVVKTRSVGGAVLALIASDLSVPSGPMAGSIRTLASAAFIESGGVWQIVWFHNTREQAPPELSPR
jgi:uncharacterized protein (TIGR02246 family)